MTEPELGYYIDRTIGLVCYPLLSSLFLLQIFTYYKSKTKIPSFKLKIHFTSLVTSVLMIIYSVDEQNVFGYYPHLVFLFVLNAAVSSITGTLCLIIFCHFQFQYTINMTQVPKIITYGLLISWTCFSLMLFFCHILMTQLNSVKWDIIWEITAMVYLLTILIIDLTGFCLVRRAMNYDLRTQEELKVQLQKITRFHIGITLACLGFISDCPYWINRNLQNGWDADENWSTPDQYNDPDLQLYFFIIALSVYLWWAWIPFSVIKESLKRPLLTKTRNRTSNSTMDTLLQIPGPPNDEVEEQ